LCKNHKRQPLFTRLWSSIHVYKNCSLLTLVFRDGTTDVTRTVLKGHIAIDTIIFPPGITGYKLDILARMALWKDGLDYRHGTGHGVGHFLNVHEGPHGIGMRPSADKHPLKPGMIVTNGKFLYE
jgi:Xaa-Pro aminopeptidase